jgi:hypothetical protein
VLSVSDVEHLAHRGDKYLAIARLPSACSFGEGVRDGGDGIICDQDRDQNFWFEVYRILIGASINLRMLFLRAEASNLSDGHINADADKPILDDVQAIWPDDRVDALHLRTFLGQNCMQVVQR